MGEGKKRDDKIDIEPCVIEVEAEEAGMPVGDYVVKSINFLLDPKHLQIDRHAVKTARVDTGGYEYRVEIVLPTDDLFVDEVYPLLRFSKQKDCGMWLSVAPNRMLRATYIWTRPAKPTRHDRLGDEPNQGR
jgi:hypothetical protein